MDEDRMVKFCARVGREVLVLRLQTVTQLGWSRSCVVLIFGKISVNTSRKRCKTETHLHWKTNRKSYTAYQMASTAVTLNDLDGLSRVAGLLKCNLSNVCAAFYTISTDSVLAVPLS